MFEFVTLLAQAETQRLPMWPMLLIIGVMFYFLVLGPDRRRRSEHASMMENMKKNDQVVTIGGIKGTVTNVRDDEVTIRVDEANNTRIRVLKSSISRIDVGEPLDKKNID